MTDRPAARLILGCGYLGRRVATRWLADGQAVAALTRSDRTSAEFAARGLTLVVGDVTEPASLAALPAADVVLHAIGYDRSAGVDRERAVLGGLRNVLDSPAGAARRWVFVSTTSVYGQSGGEWIDEHSPTEPAAENGRVALAAEDLLRGERPDATILRLSGLYGPDRLLRKADAVRSGEPVAGRADAWLNLVHVDDAADAACRAADHPSPPELVLVNDDRPLTRGEYYALLAERLGGPPPTFTGTGGRGGDGLGKRCRNGAAKTALGWTPRFPTAAEGLGDAFATRR